MTAIGSAIVFVAFVLQLLFGQPYERSFNTGERVAIFLLWTGSALVSIGVLIWLWRALP